MLNLIDYIILAVLFVCIALVIRYFIKKRKKGQMILGCNGCCENCKACCKKK